jgi:hypothetical protein
MIVLKRRINSMKNTILDETYLQLLKIIALIKTLKGSREISIVITKLEEAEMWLSKEVDK